MIGEKLSTKKLPPRVCKQFPDEFSWTRQKTAQSIMTSQMPSSIMSQIDDQHHLRAIIQSSYSSIHPQQYFFNSSINENSTTNNHRKQSFASISSSSHRSPSYRMYFSPQINSTHSVPSQSQSEEFLRSFNLVPSPYQVLNKNSKSDQDTSPQSSQPVIPSSELPKMLQHEMESQRKYYQSNQHLESKHNQLCSQERSDSFEKSHNFAIQSGTRNPALQNTGHAFLIKSQQSLRAKELLDKNVLPSLAVPGSEVIPHHHYHPRYPMKQQSQPALLQINNKWQSDPLTPQNITPNKQQLPTTESASEFNILSSSCAKQSKRSFEDSKQKLLQQLNAQSTDIFLKKASPSQQSQQKLHNINQFSPSILAHLTNQMNSIPKKDQSKVKIASSMPSTRHGSPSSWASHQNDTCLQFDQIIESDLCKYSKPARIFGRNNSLANIQSDQTQMLRLPNILPDFEAPKTTQSSRISQQKQQIKPVFLFEQKCENEQQTSTLEQIRDLKTPSFNHRQTKYPSEQFEQTDQFCQTSYFGQIPLHKQISVETHLNLSQGTPTETISTGISISQPDSDLNSSFGYKHESQDQTESKKPLNQQRIINQPLNSKTIFQLNADPIKPPQLPDSIPTTNQQISSSSSESTRSSNSRKLILSSQNILTHVTSSKLIPQLKNQPGVVSLKSIKKQNQSPQINGNIINTYGKQQFEDHKEHLNKDLELTFNSQIPTNKLPKSQQTEQKRKRRQKTEPVSLPK